MLNVAGHLADVHARTLGMPGGSIWFVADMIVLRLK